MTKLPSLGIVFSCKLQAALGRGFSQSLEAYMFGEITRGQIVIHILFLVFRDLLLLQQKIQKKIHAT